MKNSYEQRYISLRTTATHTHCLNLQCFIVINVVKTKILTVTLYTTLLLNALLLLGMPTFKTEALCLVGNVQLVKHLLLLLLLLLLLATMTLNQVQSFRINYLAG